MPAYDGGVGREGQGQGLTPYERANQGPRAFKADETTSSYGRPLAIVYGTTRVTGTVILAGIYLSGAYGVPTGLVQIALCEGSIVSVLNIWREKTVDTPANRSVTITIGTLPQSPVAYLTTNFPKLALGYGLVAHAFCSSGHATVSTGELERSSFEVRALLASYRDGSSTAYDAGPYQVINDLLTDPYHGLAWSSSQVDTFLNGADGTTASGYIRYCEANVFTLSLAIAQQRPTREIIGEVLAATDSVALWSEGTFKIRPLGESTVVGSVTYTPYVTPQYDLGYSAAGADFLGQGEPLVTVERAKRADTYNCHPVEWSNRFPARKDTDGTTISEPFNAYNADIEDGTPDPIDVANFGLRKAEPTTLRCITRAAHAKAISDILTRRALYTSRVRYRLRLGWRYALLEPTDLVTITDASLGISRRLVRIEEIEEQEDGSFDVVASEVGTITTAAAAVYTVT